MTIFTGESGNSSTCYGREPLKISKTEFYGPDVFCHLTISLSAWTHCTDHSTNPNPWSDLIHPSSTTLYRRKEYCCLIPVIWWLMHKCEIHVL